MNSLYPLLVASIEAQLREKVKAEVRAELEAEINRERVVLGKRLITKRQVWEKLGIAEDSLDRLRRVDPNFPAPKRLLGRLQWRECQLDRYIDEL